MAKRFV